MSRCSVCATRRPLLLPPPLRAKASQASRAWLSISSDGWAGEARVLYRVQCCKRTHGYVVHACWLPAAESRV
jgi:hypothetical protein